MANNFLITGYWGEPHVTAENDRGINAAIFGAGRFVLPVGKQFKAEYIGNNTVRMYDGKLMDNGAAAGIAAGEYVDLTIPEAGQGMKRNDLIVFQYSQDASSLVETGRFVVLQGTETSGTAADPALSQQDLLSGEATFDQMALWRVPVSGTTISAPVKVFTELPIKTHVHSTADINSGVLPIVRGGTGGGTAAEARERLGAAAAGHNHDTVYAKTAKFTVSVGTSWTEDTTNGGYYQTVAVSGILASDDPIADVVLGTDVDANAAYLEAWGNVTRITTAANSVTLWANDAAPATAFTVKLKVVR